MTKGLSSRIIHRPVADFVRSLAADVLDAAASHNVQVFASVTDPTSPRPAPGHLRKDYVYLFERYFYFLEMLPPRERGLVVFDELEKSQSHILMQQMAGYFLGTETGRYRSSRIVPEPFFVHSDLTTGVFLADLAAYIIGWARRLARMTQRHRPELKPYAAKLHDMHSTEKSRSRTEAGRGDSTESSTSTTSGAVAIVLMKTTRRLAKKERQ
jgi:hypothetical protein